MVRLAHVFCYEYTESPFCVQRETMGRKVLFQVSKIFEVKTIITNFPTTFLGSFENTLYLCPRIVMMQTYCSIAFHSPPRS